MATRLEYSSTIAVVLPVVGPACNLLLLTWRSKYHTVPDFVKEIFASSFENRGGGRKCLSDKRLQHAKKLPKKCPVGLTWAR